MKRTLLIALCLCIGLFLSGCAGKEPDTSSGSSDVSSNGSAGSESGSTGGEESSLVDDGSVITFTNEVEKTDVWILPDTEENRKLSVWGTPTIRGMETDKTARVSLYSLGGPGQYLVHMITPDEMYFGVSDIKLEADYFLRFYRDGEPYGPWMMEVKDADGSVIDDLEVFGARL